MFLKILALAVATIQKKKKIIVLKVKTYILILELEGKGSTYGDNALLSFNIRLNDNKKNSVIKKNANCYNNKTFLV